MQAIDIKNAFDPSPSIKADSFTVILLRLIAKSDEQNRQKLAMGYPVQVEVVRTYQLACPMIDFDMYHPELGKVPDWDKLLRMAQEAVSKKVGSTGEFPEGKLTEDDEGELRIGIGNDVESKTVVVNFGKKVSWLGLSKASALQIADAIRDHAMEF